MNNASSQPVWNVIAVDGPVGVGKSVLAHQLAKRLNRKALDTGAMYRAVAWTAIQAGASLDDPAALAQLADTLEMNVEPQDGGERILIGAEDVTLKLRTPEVTAATPRVARHECVRAAMVKRQRRMGEQGQFVAEGRDMGTVVFPQAAVKFYLTASTDERLRRRRLQMKAQGQAAGEQLMSQLIERDALDRRRASGALRVAADACVIDSTNFPEPFVLSMMENISRTILGDA